MQGSRWLGLMILAVLLTGPVAPATGNVLWMEDFHFSRGQEWTLVEGVWLVEDGVYCGQYKGNGRSLMGRPDWQDYSFTGKFRCDPAGGQEVTVLFRVQEARPGRDQGRYYEITHSLAGNRVRLRRIDYGATVEAEVFCPLEPGRWYEFEVETWESFVRYRLDGRQILSFDAAHEISGGRIGVGVTGGAACFDEFVVRSIEPSLPDGPERVNRPIAKDPPRN